jgi:endonuclease/exonuclease/phosphatase family metal-dependent hydrolase
MSKLSTSEYYRVYVYVVLENKETGARFVHVNTHLDFARAQQSQVSILLNETAHLSYMPMFYTADWNFTPGEMGYKMMHAAGYTDASVMTDNVDGGGTIIGGGEIDFCFAAIQSTSVDGYMVVDDHEFSETSSDHYPILVDLNIIK